MPLPLSSLSTLARSLTYNASPGASLRTSQSNRLVNPRGHGITEDAYSYYIRAGTPAGSTNTVGQDKVKAATTDNDGGRGEKVVDLSDEAILARFSRGFFGGTIFWPESLGLRALVAWGMSPIDFFKDSDGSTERSKDRNARAVWSVGELPESTILPRGSTICGTFQVTDVHILPSSPSSLRSSSVTSSPPGYNHNSDDQNYSYIDFSFGTTRFAGCHRFSIHRHPQPRGGEDEEIELRFTCFQCNPTQDAPPPALVQSLGWLHHAYARMLMADGLRVVLRG